MLRIVAFIVKKTLWYITIVTLSAILVVGTGEWSEDAEDLGKIL